MRFLLHLALALARLLFVPLYLFRYLRRAPRGAFVVLEIDGAVDDLVPRPRFWELWRKRALSLHELRRALDEACADPRLRGVLVVLRSLRGGMATAASLRAMLGSVRARGKELAVHLPLGADTRELYVATAAGRIIGGPQATLAPVGFAARARYLKGALEKAGVVPEVFARGAYKSAGELLIREEMSAAQREQLDRILDGLHEALVSALAERPGIDRARAAALIDGAPYSGAAAVAAGLADAVAYDDEVAGALGGVKLVPLDAYLAGRRALRFWPRRAPGIAVIRVHGAIATGSRFVGAAEGPIIAAIRATRRSRRIRGAVLHVSSPGGGALASDRIHHELEQLAREKPLVAYLSDVAASGGYYVAAAAHEIVAQPLSVTGSIGVVAARLNVEPLLERLGVRSVGLQRGARAHLVDPLGPLTEGDRGVFERELESAYQAFLAAVARGRRRGVEEIRAVAEGRVWTGADARERGLVDRLGGFDVALEAVRARIGAPLEPALMRAGRRAGPPLDPPEVARALVAGATGMPPIDRRERVLAYCGLADALGERV